MKLGSTLLLATVCAYSATAAITVNVIASSVASSGQYQTPTGGLIDTSYELQWGIFDRAAYDALPEAQKTDFSVVSGLLSSNQTLTADASGNILSTSAPGNSFNLPLAGGATGGEQLYTLVYNTLDTNIFGLFTSTSNFWKVPTNEPGTSILTNSSFATTGEALVGSFEGSNALLANTVPEPSTYALLAGVMTLGLVAYRRRQKA